MRVPSYLRHPLKIQLYHYFQDLKIQWVHTKKKKKKKKNPIMLVLSAWPLLYAHFMVLPTNPINPGGRWRTCQRNVRLYTSSLIVSRRLLLEKLVVNTTLL